MTTDPVRIAADAMSGVRWPDGDPYVHLAGYYMHEVAEAVTTAVTAAGALMPDEAKALREDRDRLARLLGGHADGHRCTCKMTRHASYTAMTPAEWEQDPWCPTHPDVDFIRAEKAALIAEIRALHSLTEHVTEDGEWYSACATDDWASDDLAKDPCPTLAILARHEGSQT